MAFNLAGLCKEVNCIKGTCDDTLTGNLSNLVPRCHCDPGWSQPDIGIAVPFLPCVIPNCTLNQNCSSGISSPAPPPPLIPPANHPPCSASACGEGGSCQLTSNFSYVCKCSEGYVNLLNSTAAPCIRECKISASFLVTSQFKAFHFEFLCNLRFTK
ncbi:uncharacterized protein LOC131030209 [Cryptomeria japonica]|uniref:uncharacterized protein LOC131030209 n=1 Tax=Cryptomeria japonica TaxID=3369 RepID=UPI0027DA0CE4|nr:uncharacterized protein LOC131030209 [Cryptomeria japonica]